MNSKTLVATHLSAFYPSSAHAVAHAVLTSRRDIPLVEQSSSLPDSHASYSRIFHSPYTGNILLRILQADSVIELISLSSPIAPIRFVFPARVLPSPSLVVWEGRQLHLIAVTSVNSLYRLILPINDGVVVWHNSLRRDWCREWQVKKLGGSCVRLVYVQDFHSVAVALASGSILRLDTEFIDGDNYDERWNESEYTIHNWYSSLLPVRQSNHILSSEIISLASLAAPGEFTDVFSLSRDRVLRRWTIGKGCKAEIALRPTTYQPPSEQPPPLLEFSPGRYIQVLPKTPTIETELDFVIVAYTPARSYVARGEFHVYSFSATGSQPWRLISKTMCSIDSVPWTMEDFLVSNGALYVLWENQGQSMLEMTPFSIDKEYTINWTIASYRDNSELSQLSIDELLSQPGSLADKFMQAIFKPGLFSFSTIRSAIHEYTSHHLSIDGSQPDALSSTYSTLSENVAAVVGCTVVLRHDPHTGLAQFKQYWSALRRDWEGFIAYCREIERSARWPSALGIDLSSGQILVVERERIAQCVEEDSPLHIYRCLTMSSQMDPAYSLLDTSWILRRRLGRPVIKRIESEILNIIHQEVAFPLADIIFEASNRVFDRSDLDDGLENLVLARISDIEDLDQVIRSFMDVIGGLEGSVKREEDEVELILPPTVPEWQRGLNCAYISDSVHARYEICLALITLLFFIGEEILQREPSVLAEVFAVFRGVAIVRFLCEQPAGDLDNTRSLSADSDDVVARFSTMNVSQGPQNPKPTYSLVYHLLSQSSHGLSLPVTAHVFLDQCGLFSTMNPAYASKSEVALSDRLRSLGYRELAQEILSWLPRTSAVTYSLGKLWIETGRGDDAVLILQGLAGCFGVDGFISSEDQLALASILPGGLIFASELDYYLHVAELFRLAGLVSYEVFFAKLAMSVASNDQDMTEVWAVIVKGLVDLNRYEDAYSAICNSPYTSIKERFISQLVYKMCENEASGLLVSMNFSGLTKEVEESLSFKARNADPRVRPYYSQILYAWYIERGDYQSAASTMYLRARRLSEIEADPTQLLSSLESQLEGLVVAMNALSILDSNSAWITVPYDLNGSRNSKKRRKMSRFIPDNKCMSGQRDIDVVTRTDLQQEYALLMAKIELARRDPSVLANTDSSRSSWIIVSKLTQYGLYDMAMYVACMLDIDMSELFEQLAIQCIRLSSTKDAIIPEMASDWLLSDKVSSWPGSPADRAWRYLRQALDRHDTPETDFKYSKAVLEVLLSNNAGSPPPPWLIESLENHHPDHLIRTCLRFNLLEDAITHTLSLLRKANAKIVVPNSQTCQTWVSYTLVDAVLKAAESDESSILPHIKNLSQTLSKELSERISRMQRQSGRAQ